MTSSGDARPMAPWHFWMIAGVLTCWYGWACTDYVLSIPPADSYLRLTMSETEIALFKQEPLSTWIVWAGGVWPNLAGALLLLARSRWVFWGFALGLPFDLFNFGHILFAGNSLNYGVWGLIGVNGLVLGGLIGLLYTHAMSRRGVLR